MTAIALSADERADQPIAFTDATGRQYIHCDGGCGGHLLRPWYWRIDGRNLCGNCAEKAVDGKAKKVENNS